MGTSGSSRHRIEEQNENTNDTFDSAFYWRFVGG